MQWETTKIQRYVLLAKPLNQNNANQIQVDITTGTSCNVDFMPHPRFSLSSRHHHQHNYIVFPPPSPSLNFHCFLSTTATILLFFNHNSVVFPPPPQLQLYCFPNFLSIQRIDGWSMEDHSEANVRWTEGGSLSNGIVVVKKKKTMELWSRWQSWRENNGCLLLPITKSFRKIWLRSKWNSTFWCTQAENFRRNGTSKKVAMFYGTWCSKQNAILHNSFTPSRMFFSKWNWFVEMIIAIPERNLLVLNFARVNGKQPIL